VTGKMTPMMAPVAISGADALDSAPVRDFVAHHRAVLVLAILCAVGEGAVYMARLAFGW
jgi:hypothetical protein